MHICLNRSGKMANSGGDDLEDGEIFDDEEDEIPTPTHTNSAPAPAAAPVVGGMVEEKKVVPRKPLPPRPPRRQKRPREDDRPFRNNKQRRRSDESGEKPKGEKPRDNLTEDEEMREMSPLRGDWDRIHHRPGFGDDLLDDDDDDLDGGRRVNRGFNRRRGGRNARGGRRGMNNRRDGGQICRFYLQGKCQRGNDCPYSHASRKFELCKFYMMDCCAKKDRCPFLHSEFPCKYYHLGMKCFAGKKCKFSHGKISSQLRNNLLRDSKECDFLQHSDSSQPKDDEIRRERRDRRHREREHREKERKKPRERKSSKDDDKYTLHFKVDPRTISEDEEGQQTPMPSPTRDNSSDRDPKSPKAEVKPEIVSPKSEVQLPDPKDSGIGEELPDFIPADLPKHQRELYKRIQQQQREATSLEDGNENDEMEEEKEQDDFKDEDWYSSEEEDSVKKMEPITALLNKLKQQPPQNVSPPVQQQVPPPAPIIVPPVVLPDIDINAVSKLLSTVRETIQQKQNKENLNKGIAAATTTVAAVAPTTTAPAPSLNLNPLPPLTALLGDTQPPPEKRQRRDPRLRGSDDDVDLRRQDVDLRQLPFKPAPIQPPANEIDASITTHPPLAFHLVPLSPPPPPDYSHLPKNANDPRLRRYISGGVLTGPPVIVPPVVGAVLGTRPPLSSRDPRQARILPNDPRRKKVDSDLRQAFNHVDIDLRVQPPHLAFK